jgi:hypothetical protein
MLGLQGASEYRVNGNEVCIFSAEILMTWNWKYTTDIIAPFWVELLREAKQLYYNELIANSENKVKMTWKIINNLIGKIQNSQRVSPTFKVDGV